MHEFFALFPRHTPHAPHASLRHTARSSLMLGGDEKKVVYMRMTCCAWHCSAGCRFVTRSLVGSYVQQKARLRGKTAVRPQKEGSVEEDLDLPCRLCHMYTSHCGFWGRGRQAGRSDLIGSKAKFGFLILYFYFILLVLLIRLY